MQTAYGNSLISTIPLQDLLLFAIVFTVAALILLALSIEAGNYPKLRAKLRQIHQALRRPRPLAPDRREANRHPAAELLGAQTNVP
jgi:hypothetical protein